MKKLLQFGITTLLALSFSTVALAANARTSGLFTYELKGNGTATITGFDWENNGENDIFVPSMIDGYSVTGIGESAFKDSKSLWRNAVNVTLPETIVSIGKKAFFDCMIKSINIPNSVEMIMPGALRTRNYDVLYNVASGHKNYATIDRVLYDKNKKELIAFASEWDGYCELEVPEGIRSVGPYAFYKESIDQSIYVKLPDTVQSLGDYAFAECTINNLFMQGVKELGEGVFYNCTIHNCSAFSNQLTTIPDYAFYSCMFKSNSKWSMPTGVTYIGKSAFEDVYSFGSLNLELPNGLKRIGESAFQNIRGISVYELVIPDSVEYIGKNAFRCFDDTLMSVTLPNSACEIQAGSFSENENLTSVVIPESITSIDIDAFERGSIKLTVSSGSYGELFAKENGFGYVVEGQEDNLDWLNN